MERKITLGRWFDAVFVMLRAMRRGTKLDPFGSAGARREERRMVADYRAVIDTVTAQLTTATHAIAIELAA